MESEKVKEIKELLKEEILIATSFDDKLRRVSTKFLQEILTLINELESENTFLRDMITKFRQENTTLYEDIYKKIVKDIGDENQELKDRIAELGKENKDYYDRLNNLQTYIDNHEEIWKVNTKMQLKQFAEMLKEKAIVFFDEGEPIVLKSNIDETLIETTEGI